MDQDVSSAGTPEFASVTIGGVPVVPGGTDHTALSNLGWTASGHTGTAARLAGFFEGGQAGYAGFGAGMYLDDDDNIAVSNSVITGAAAGAAAVPASDTAYLAALTNVTGSGGIVITGSGRERDIDGSAFVKTESDPVASSNLTAHIDTTGANDAHGMSNTVVLAAGAVQTNETRQVTINNAFTNTFGGALTVLGTAVQGGSNTVASGLYGATAFGADTVASGITGATALGDTTAASGLSGATALGSGTTASGNYGATALGSGTTASGNYGAAALGYNSRATNDSAFAWSGQEADYTDNGPGTFNIDPVGGFAGIYVGTKTLADYVSEEAGGISAATATNIAQTVAAAPIALEQYIGTHITLTAGATVTVPGTAAQYSLAVTNAWTLALTNGHPRYGFFIEVDGTNSMSYPAAWHSVDPTYEAMSTNVISVTPYGTTNWSIFAVGVN
jgi:hypothetical protein